MRKIVEAIKKFCLDNKIPILKVAIGSSLIILTLAFGYGMCKVHQGCYLKGYKDCLTWMGGLSTNAR